MKENEQGYTLIELLTAVGLAAILMTLGAFSLRQYWLVRSLGAAGEDVTAQLRTMQQQAASESSPLIFGASFTPDTSAWSTVRYSLGSNVADAADDSCVVQARQMLDTGVTFLGTTTFESSTQVSPTVLSSGCGITSTDKVVLFFPKGTATRGHVDLRQPALGRSAGVCVSGLTARVSQRSIEETASC